TSSAVKIEMVLSSAAHFSMRLALPSRMRRMRLFFTCMRPATMSPTSWRTCCRPSASHRPSATSLPRVAISWLIAMTVMGSLFRGRWRVAAAQHFERLGNQRPEEEQGGEAGDRTDQGVGEEDAHVALRCQHRLAEGVFGAIAEHES